MHLSIKQSIQLTICIYLYIIYIYVGALTVFLSIHLYHYDHFPLVSNTAISLRTSNSQCCPSIPSGANGFAGWYHMFAMDMGLYGSDHSSKKKLECPYLHPDRMLLSLMYCTHFLPVVGTLAIYVDP